MFNKKKPPAPVAEGEELKKWSSQIRKGSLEMCLLGVIANRPRYGFEIVQMMSTTGGLMVTGGDAVPALEPVAKREPDRRPLAGVRQRPASEVLFADGGRDGDVWAHERGVAKVRGVG